MYLTGSIEWAAIAKCLHACAQPDTDEEHEEEPAAEEQGTLQSQRRSLRPRKSLKVDTDFATEEAAGADGDGEAPVQPNGPGEQALLSCDAALIPCRHWHRLSMPAMYSGEEG